MKILFRILTIFPLKIAFYLIDCLYSLLPIYLLQTLSSFQVTKKNLTIAFPGLSKKEILQLSKRSSMKKVISIGGERIKDGYVVLIFPEGTRRKPEDGIGKFGNSCGVLAANESVPIIPICHNSGKYWINKSFKKKFYF